MTSRDVQLLSRWLIVAIAIHNFEEWLGRARLPRLQEELASRAGLSVSLPNADLVESALLIATLVPAAVLAVCSAGSLTRTKALAVAFVSGILVANAFLPHVAATVALGRYTPGVATAVLVNVPLCTIILVALHRSGCLTFAQLATAIALAAAALPVVIAGAYGAASGLR